MTIPKRIHVTFVAQSDDADVEIHNSIHSYYGTTTRDNVELSMGPFKTDPELWAAYETEARRLEFSPEDIALARQTADISFKEILELIKTKPHPYYLFVMTARLPAKKSTTPS